MEYKQYENTQYIHTLLFLKTNQSRIRQVVPKNLLITVTECPQLLKLASKKKKNAEINHQLCLSTGFKNKAGSMYILVAITYY